MTKQAVVGLFVIVGAIALFAVFYVLGDIGTRSRGYKMGVHFKSAEGLHRAAPVSLSGVVIGAVDDVQLEPDYSVDVILAISPYYEIPKGSLFQIAAPLTGEPSVVIQPPHGPVAATLPHEILPLDKQPQGGTPVSLQDLLEQGQGEAKRFDRILAQLEVKTPILLNELDSALRNANDLTTSAKLQLAQVGNSATSMMNHLDRAAGRAGDNLVDLTTELDQTVRRNSAQIDGLLASLNHTSASMGKSVDSLRDFATNPKVKQDLLDTTHSFAVTAKTFAELSGDLRQVTGNPQTQAQLRDTVAHFDATAERLDSLLGQLGGKSSVYGVDRSATPAPGGATPLPPGFVPTSKPALSVTATAPPARQPPTGPGVLIPSGASTQSPRSPLSPELLSKLKERVNAFTKDLVQLQVRVSQLSAEQSANVLGNTSPLLTVDRGPQTDFNLSILPHGQTSLLLGVNDAGGATSTANFMLLSRRGGLQYGGGMEYSRLGMFTAINGSHLGFEAAAYDLRHPTLDAYGNVILAPKLQLFGGERDITHQDRRTIFGFQFEI
jgi:phospholipid/cholesterol/gamma-HCH transport system substrate-binding protein